MGLRCLVTMVLPALILAAGEGSAPPAKASRAPVADRLVGAWQAKVQFKGGALAAVKDLEFMYAFHGDGTLNESSNYDASPPVPPAYGAWRRLKPGQYEARYVFFMTKPPKAFDDLAGGGGWSPGGQGVLVERITLSGDGKSFTSKLRLDLFDETGRPTESGSQAEVHATRIDF